MKIKHGGDLYSHTIQYDFSANLNPLGMPDSVKEALIANLETFQVYPDPDCRQLLQELSQKEQIPEDYITCGNGAADLIYKCVQIIKPKKALLPVPSFLEYEKALEEIGCKITYYFCSEEKQFQIQEDLKDLLEQDGYDMLFLCNPNNPTGTLLNPQLRNVLMDTCRKKGTWVLLDECFMDLVEDEYRSYYDTFRQEDRIIVLKAFTKTYAMAGLRLGYCICPNQNLNRRIREMGQCWSVSVPAQIAGVAALQEEGYLMDSRELIEEERIYLSAKLRAMGFTVFPSYANFLLFFWDYPKTDPVQSAICNGNLKHMLLEQGIQIRDCSDFVGLKKGYYRIAIRTHEENTVLVDALERLLK